jgi:hypothetical protein
MNFKLFTKFKSAEFIERDKSVYVDPHHYREWGEYLEDGEIHISECNSVIKIVARKIKHNYVPGKIYQENFPSDRKYPHDEEWRIEYPNWFQRKILKRTEPRKFVQYTYRTTESESFEVILSEFYLIF